MKRTEVVLTLLPFCLSLTLYAQQGNFIIKGTVSPASSVVKVFTYRAGLLDSAMVNNGSFQFTGHVDNPRETLVFVSTADVDFHTTAGKVYPVPIYEEPGTIFLDIKDSTGKLAVSGSKTNDDLNAYNTAIKDVTARQIIVTKALNDASKEEKAKLIEKRFSLYNEQNLISIQFAREHRDSYVSLDRLYFAARVRADLSRLDDIQKVYDALDEGIRKSQNGQEFAAMLTRLKGSTVGGIATDFTNQDSLGHPVALHDFRGKFVLVDFWASWCGPCRAENPNVIKAYEKYKDRQFTVLAVSLDKKTARDKWLGAIQKDGMPYPQVNDPNGETAKLYGINAIPQNFLIDPQGKVIAANLRGDSLQNKLAALLDKHAGAYTQQKLDSLSNSSNERDVNAAMMYYVSNKQTLRFDSLMLVAAKRFPTGTYAYAVGMNHLYDEPDPILQERLLKQLQTKFPEKKPSDFDQAQVVIADNFARKKNTAKVLTHLKAIKSVTLDCSTAIIDLMDYDPSAAEHFLSEKIDTLKAMSQPPAVVYHFEVIESQALNKLDRNAASLEYARDAYEHQTTASDAVTTYATALCLNGRYEQAIPLLSQTVVGGKSTNELNGELLVAYHATHPQDNAQSYLDSLNEVLATTIRSDMAPKMIDETAPSFTVTDEQGRAVSLAELKGKIVVVDFWATWCGPCKASLPVMQRAVNKYKNDSSVRFLFVHTYEKSSTPLRDAQDYFRSNHYTLPLYMDMKDQQTNINPAVTAFNVHGIPTKFIIDANGHIRFRLTGFSRGRDDASAAEVAAMIELTRRSI